MRAPHPLGRLGAALVAFSTIGCSDEAETTVPPTSAHEPATYALTPEPYTVLQAVWEPLIPSAQTLAAIEAGELAVTDVDRFAEHGLGVRLVDGHEWTEHLELAPDFAATPPGTRRSLLYLWQSADPQLIDEESPIRLEGFTDLYRPQGHLSPQMFEAHVRTAQRISDASDRPFDFAILTGDLTDGSQRNELQWMITAVVGGQIDPDSGADDDPVTGPGNDYNDPFVSDGLDVPWYAVLGNHETLFIGGFGPITDELRQAAVGEALHEHALFRAGFCDGSTPNADVATEGTTPADPNRLPLRLPEVLQELLDAPGQPAGHGLSEADVAAGRGYFSVQPLADKPLRLIGLDTVNSEANSIGIGAQGWFDAEQLSWLEQELADADAAHELVVVMSHHRVQDFADSSPVTGDELAAVLEASEGVVLHLVGHGHLNDAHAVPEPPVTAAQHGYWQLMLSSSVDFPSHSRIIEIVDEDNGYLSVYATNVGHNSPVDSLAHHGRELSGAKRVFGTPKNDAPVDELWQQDLPAQNLLLRIPVPDVVRAELTQHSWPERIESEETLRSFAAP